jgi:methionyl-tRNA synthetase
MEPGDALNAVMGDALEALRIVTILANPALPTTTQEIWNRIGLTGNITDLRIHADTKWGHYTGGTTVVKGQPLFPRLTV